MLNIARFAKSADTQKTKQNSQKLNQKKIDSSHIIMQDSCREKGICDMNKGKVEQIICPLYMEGSVEPPAILLKSVPYALGDSVVLNS